MLSTTNSLPQIARKSNRKATPTLLKGKETVLRSSDRTGERMERSQLMTQSEAALLCAILSTQPNIQGAEMQRDHHVTGTQVQNFVRFHRLPALEADTSVKGLVDIRIERAVLQFQETTLIQDADDPELYHCIHLYTAPLPDGSTCGLYAVRQDSCSCPDFQFRSHKIGCCKHLVRLRAQLGQADLRKAPLPTITQPTRYQAITPERQAQFEQNRYADFG